MKPDLISQIVRALITLAGVALVVILRLRGDEVPGPLQVTVAGLIGTYYKEASSIKEKIQRNGD